MVHTAYIALGSNLGDRGETMRAALEKLDQTRKISVTKISGFLENPAVGGPVDSPRFLNTTAEIQTTLDPRSLLDELLRIEQSLGRHRREKWGPRTIDLDLLLYDQQCIDQPGLIVPHPLMHQRRFVLQPLAEIAGEVVHPRLNMSIGQLLQLLQAPLDTKP